MFVCELRYPIVGLSFDISLDNAVLDTRSSCDESMVT